MFAFFNGRVVLTRIEPSKLLFLEQSTHKTRCVDCHLLSQFIKALLDFVLSFHAFLLHFSFDSFELILLLLLKLCFFVGILLLGGKSDLDLELLLHFLIRFVLGFGVFFLKLFNFVILILLEFFKFDTRLIHDFLHFWVDHELLHL